VSPATDPADDPRAHADAAKAWSFALSLADGASPRRVDAVISLLVQQLAADPDRISAAAAVCQARHRDGGVGNDRAAALLGNALSAVRDAGGDTDDGRDQLLRDIDARWNPERVPYRWPTRRRRDPRWWIRRLRLLRARVAHEPPAVPAGRQRLTISHRGGVVGVMRFQVCDECRCGLVGEVSIDSHLQGLGLGTRLVERAFRAHPGYAWHTTAQYDTAGSFWPRMARRTGAAFTAPANARCRHVTDNVAH
jgi:hypothetical protein